MSLQLARTISRSGRKSPAPRPPSPRFANVPAEERPPLPTPDPRNSPLLRTTSPSSTDGWPSVPTFFPTPHPYLSPQPRQLNSARSGHTTPLQPRSATPSDILYQLHDLTGQITRDREHISARGAYGGVYTGVLRNGTKVAIKVLHPRSEADEKKMSKRFRKEIRVWQGLVHPNVVPLLGTTADFGRCTGMVSPWMENGSMTAFLAKMAATLSDSARMQLLCDVAAGLTYLHSNFVIHGDLSGENILIDAQSNARLVDFGLSTIKAEFEGTSYYSSTIGGALRWRAPELLSEDKLVLDFPCDIYSYGSVVLQVLSGKVPYHEHKLVYSVVLALSQGIQPERPMELRITDALWEFIQHCWDRVPDTRPCIKEVNDRISAFHRGCVNRDRCLTIRSTDGYETDSEAFHTSKQRTKSSGWQSESESRTSHRKSTKKSRVVRPNTMSLLKTAHSRSKTTAPTVCSIDFQNLSSGWKEIIKREVSVLATATHPNIRKVIDVEASDMSIRLSLEPIVGLSLRDILQRTSLKMDQVSCLSSKILDGLRHLHGLGIVHGNLNSSNIVLETQGCVKLVDFGLSAKAARGPLEHDEVTDNPYWTAPEFIADRQYASAMDIWSLGIISIEMVEKQPPYFDMKPYDARQLITERGTPRLKDPNMFTSELLEFLSLCLIVNVLKRATASELVPHNFLVNSCSTVVLIPLLNIGLLPRVF